MTTTRPRVSRILIGMDWLSYYHRNGSLKFPFADVHAWNTHDHGVNNAEGAVRWPAVTYRMTGRGVDAAQVGGRGGSGITSRAPHAPRARFAHARFAHAHTQAVCPGCTCDDGPGAAA
jgi:hypothetical protein